MSDHAPNRKDKKPAPASKSKRPASKNRLVESLEERHLLAVSPQLVAIQPNSGDVLADGAQRHVAPEELTLVFSELQQIDPATLDGIQVIRSGFDGAFDGVTDVMVQPGYIGVNPDRTNEVIVRFAESLPDDTYRIQISAIDDAARNLVALRNVEGDPFLPRLAGADRTIITFDLDLGAQVVGVVPQPISRNADGSLSQARNQIQVYFNNDDLDPVKAVNSAFYRLVFTNDTVNNTDDVVYTPTQVEYDAQRDLVVLTFADDIEKLSSGEGTYRLRIGTDEIITDTPVEITPAEDPGSSFATANDLGTLVPGAKLVTAAIDPNLHPLDFPGSNDEPGHREIAQETHLIGISDASAGITTLQYNFKEIYGQDQFENDLFNLITENQKNRAREIFELYGSYLGVQFEETDGDGIIVVTGDLRELDDMATVATGGVLGIAGFQQLTNQPMIILDSLERWDDSFGETIEPNRFSWMEVAMHEIGHLLGLGHATDVAPYSVMAGQIEDTQTLYDDFIRNFEYIFPGDVDVLHGQYLHRPESNDIDVYRLDLPEKGKLSLEVIAERQADSSLLDSYLTLYREQNGRRVRIAGNDDYFSEDSFLELELGAGTYYVAVTSTGNSDFDPTVEDSGFGGTSDGPYQLRLDFRPQADNVLTDATGTMFDGDADGIQGGIYNFWFRAVDANNTTFVDKAAPAGGDGTLASPYNNLRVALSSANAPAAGGILRVVGNGGTDGDVSTLGDNLAYEIGNSGGRLADGSSLTVPAGVSMMVDAGTVFKMLNSNVHVGSSAVGIDRSESALQILGTPEASVVFTSYDDQSIGVDTNPRVTSPDAGDWGGLIFQNDVDRKEGRFDYEQEGIFLNFVNHADIRYGGGNVVVDSVQSVVAPIHMISARPTIAYNTIQHSADAAMSANPNSFEESRYAAIDSFGVHYQDSLFTPGYDRVGPDIRGNRLFDNSINGIFVRIETPVGDSLEKLTVTGRWDDTDIVHVVSENLTIQGTPGGPLVDAETDLRIARLDASLKIDPKLVVKLDGSRIEATVGAQLLAEGNSGQAIIFTSLLDDRYGAGGMFQTSAPDSESIDVAAPGDWGGIYIGPVARGSLDNAVLAYGGGLTRVEGSFAGFNVVETRQGHLRIANSTFENNANGRGGQSEITREGRGPNDEAAIFVRGAQPVIVGNIFRGTAGFEAGAINIDVNSLNYMEVHDNGRSSGLANAHSQYLANKGPLIRENRLENNSINGMVIRGGYLTTESVWDDTDIVHVLFDEVTVSNFHTYGGLKLQSSPSESLVVKMRGNDAGFKATGRPREIEDRIGGRVEVVGQPGRPVVLTSLDDGTVGAGLDPQGRPQNQTVGNSRAARTNAEGSFQIDLNFGPTAIARPEVVEAMEAAAAVWEDLLEDPITVRFDVELAALGSLYTNVVSDNVGAVYDQVRAAMIADAGAHEQIVSQIPAFADLNVSLPFDAVNPYVIQPTMTLTSANAKALGLPGSGAVSAYDPSESRDGTIQMNINPTDVGEFFDYDRSDGIQPNYVDFVGAAISAIGLGLGFDTSVINVAAGQRTIEMTPMDMYRLEPGAGNANFADAPRALDPTLTHVFYDGGRFDSVDYPIPGIEAGDIPLESTGTNPATWASFPNYIGTMGATRIDYRGQEVNLTEADRTAFDLIGWDVTGGGHAGDWTGITLEQYSHDRNVATVSEYEPISAVAPGTNATSSSAQFLGKLGQGEKDSDENLRLGFAVNGVIHERNDVDVFSFDAKAGTEVWLDIDRTSSSLDSVVELIDSNGVLVARSDNSIDDTLIDSTIEASSTVKANGLQKSLFQTKDHFSTNPKDAGFRVVLPGQLGQDGTYFVRVRSAGTNLANVSGGLTKGAYELQIRLAEQDEIAGSSIQYADIRFAKTGVRIKGLPAHSPLTGEVVEMPVDDNTPMAVGNLTGSDRAAVSISGVINQPAGDEVDYYSFQIAQESLQAPGGIIPVVFDLDYSDGLSRADLSVFLYDSTGTDLLYVGNLGSQVSDDRPAPFSGDGLDDLSRGTVGALDPFLGGVALPAGDYILAVSTSLPVELNQYTAKLAEDVSARLEPIPELQRIAQDHVGDLGPFIASPIQDPVLPVLFTPRNAVPFHLGDVELFVSTSTGLFSVDPFTGARETSLGSYSNAAIGLPAPMVDDFALRDNPVYQRGSVDPEAGRSQRFYAYVNAYGDPNRPPTTDANTGGYVWMDISAGTSADVDHGQAPGTYVAPQPGQLLVRGTGENGAVNDDGLQTYDAILNDEGEPEIVRANNGEGEGIYYSAITFEAPAPDVVSGLAIGWRNCAACESVDEPPLQNILYRFDAASGLAISSTGAEKADAELTPVENPIGANAASFPDAPGPGAGTQIAEVGVLRVEAPDPVTGDIGPGGLITGIAFVGGPLFGVSDQGHVFRIAGTNARYVATVFDDDGEPVNFQGLTAGPADVEGGAYRRLMFAVTRDGEMYALDQDGIPQPVFVDGQTHVSTGVRGAVGLEFGGLDENLWKVTTDRGGDSGHTGTNSLYFGEDTVSGVGRAYDFAGGAHGSIVSNEFSLATETIAESPVLMFNYFLVTELGADSFTGSARDTVRVFIADDSDVDTQGQWQLLASNYTDDLGDVWDLNPSDDVDTFVVPLFDNSWQEDPASASGGRDAGTGEQDGVWRQALIDLSDFAGSDSLRIRFDVATAGSMDYGPRRTGGSELRAVDAIRIQDGDQFVIDGTTFEFDSGYSIILPDVKSLQDGETITIGDGTVTTVFEMDQDGSVSGTNVAVPIAEGDSPFDLSELLATLIEQSNLAVAPVADNTRVALTGATEVTIAPGSNILVVGDQGVSAGSTPVVIDANWSDVEVAEAMRQPIADVFANGLVDTIKSYTNAVRIIGHGIDDVGPLGMTRVLPGDGLGSFANPLRFRNNTQVRYDGDGNGDFGVDPGAGQDDPDFDIVQEGIYIDDIIIGFAKRGYIAESENSLGAGRLFLPDDQGGILEGEYQVEIRRAGAFSPAGNVTSIVASDRLVRGVTLTAVRGVDVFDGQTFTVSDGVNRVVFEYENTELGNGTAAGHVAISYSIADSSLVMAEKIRDAINAAAFEVRATTGEGNDEGVSESTRIDLTQNAVLGFDQAPNGIEFTVYDFFGDSNLKRDQGQIIVDANTITRARDFGVFVDDGLRDLPQYNLFDPLDQVHDAQFATGDYLAHPGPVRNLREINEDQLAPGVSITNNVIAFGGSGGIRFGGDPNGFLVELTDPLTITDLYGHTETVNPSIADIENSNLNVDVLQGEAGRVYIEGAASITGVIATPVSPGAVPFGRIVNNTIVGQGGAYTSPALYEPGDFTDIGILVEDNASPTLVNNIMVNLDQGVVVDLSANGIVQGGSVFQANLRNALNIGVGDFAMRLAIDEPLFVDWQRGNFYPADLSRIIDSSVDSLEDRPNLVTVKDPLGISRSPVLAPEYDALGQLRIDDPRVELSGGAGDNVFKDRGAIDRVDFLGPIAQISVPADNDQDGLDENPNVDKIRVQSSSLTRFVIDLNDLGEAETTTGTGMDDGLVTSDTLTLLRDGIPLIEGEDYRFDYQATTNQILLTPLAGLWLPGYRYEIILTNVDQFEVATGPGADVLDAQTITITAPDPTSETGVDKTVILEFESGYTVSIPQPLSLVIPSGTSGLSAIADRETFDVTNGTTRLTFEFDSTGLITPGRIRIPFTPSSTPDEVAAAVTQALTNAGLGLAPRNLGGGVIQIGVGPNTGGNNFAIDTSLTAMVQQGVAGAVRDGGLFTITQNNVVRTFEFDTNNRITTGNVQVPISYANTQDEIADAMVTAISNTTLGLAPINIGGGRVHIGGNAPTTGAAGTVVRVNQSSLTLTGAPGIVSLDPQVDPDLQPEVITIPYQPSATVDQAAMSQLILQAIQQSSLDGLVTFVNESGELVIQGATDVVGGNALFVPGLRDIAGNALQTNQDSSPFDVRFEIDLPVEMDFGDAPDPSYATLLSSNGARHVVAENVFLGAGVNSEIDGQPNASASGDAGDDGVTFASPVVIGGNVPASIVASTVGYVDAWIDFNADGTFDDSSERVLASYRVSAGTNQVRLAIPSDATAGNSFARFRFSTGGQLLPTGRADNGEVEDYQVSLVAVAAPIAASDVYSVEEDATLQISAANGLLANDVDPQGDALVPVVVNSPSNGTLTLQADGGFTYQPEADFFGSDQFSYYVTDDVQNSETVTVDITVTSVADAPTAGNDQATVLEDSSVTIPVTANDVDPDGALDVTTVQITTPPANGSVVVNANGSVEYTPDTNFFGTDTFSYTVRDQEDAVSAPAQVTINVTAVNDAPVATNDLVATRRGQSRTISLLTNDTDIDGSVDPTSIIVTRNPKSGSITLNGDGTITFTPLANFEGTDTFAYTVQDDQDATSNEATVTITVSGGNLSPIANDDAVTTRIERPIVISVLSNDEDVDGEIVEGSVAVVQQPANGLVTVNADGTIRYTPNTAFSGADTFRYTVQDEEGLTSNVAIVTVTVSRPPWQNPNDALDVNNDGFISPIDALLVINELNANGSRALDPPPISSAPFSPPPFVDVSGDDYLSPIDALLVINHLNADAAEGETAEGEWNDSQLVGAALHITPRTTSIASQAVEQAFAGSNQNDDRPVNSGVELELIGSVLADPFVKNDIHAADSAIDADLLDQLADDLKNVWKR